MSKHKGHLNYHSSLIILFLSLICTTTEQQQPQQFSNLNNFPLNNSRSPTNSRVASCQRGDCYPETGDLLIGRTKFLHASSTCGQAEPKRYCVLGTTPDSKKCFVCDSREPYNELTNPNSHLIENIVWRKQSDRFNRWWQSENSDQQVYIQFDLEAEFAFTHIIMTFKTFRPAAMLIEKSSDFGRTWKAYGYFASNCADSFPGISTYMPKNLGDVYCESKYSSDTPSTKGEVVFKILPPTLIQSRDPYSTQVQDLLKITNLRINFTRLHTFGDDLLDSRSDITEKYYYALYEMVVRGSCLCYGHASRCIPVQGVQYDTDKGGMVGGMVHGQCQCQHFTSGTNCEQCMPLYNDRKWMPAKAGQTNECKKCQCYNHAISCHFDENIYRSNAMISGGVCDDCQHNTHGINCENCKPDYWRDPNRPIDDINTCRPCLCDKAGSLNDAKCDPFTDASMNLIAGRCHCKSLVDGDHCQHCKNGYFNLTAENPDGCQPCSCNLIGTNGNLGCDKSSGLCECKAFVTGRACDECRPNHFGLSAEDPNGCKPCDCSPGGSYDNNCDVSTGQCKCKPNMGGRACDKPLNGYYCPTLDHLVYEAEYAAKTDYRSQDYNKSVHADHKPTWTGPGFVRVFEGSSLEFSVDNIHRSGSYELVVRYENSQADAWEDLRITIVRLDGPVNIEDACADYTTQDDEKFTALPTREIYSIVSAPTCLEKDRRYKIKLNFVKFSSNVAARDASVLVDSILLIPLAKDLPALQGVNAEKLLEEFNHYRCKEEQLNVGQEEISEACTRFICNIDTFHDFAVPCECDQTGSVSSICSVYGGECQCKPNVVGRKCDKCAPSTWEFSPNGCQPCNCNSGGSKNNYCNLETGQCDCYENIEGKQCDRCLDNHWRFPACDLCSCNGLADTCNQTNGKCINCREHTFGDSCENCEDGYYGRPAENQPCKECMCPGGSSGNQFAPTCYFDDRAVSVVCACQEGYVGLRCDKCASHYYGNPLAKGGSCAKCECNDNVDLSDSSSCDQATGQCRNCLYNTDGEHCEKCKPGYYGNAANHDCKPCNCYVPGTEDNSALNCDQETGQCNCLPNVIGKHCDQCKPDHYGLSSREGCKHCDCDTLGTVNNATDCQAETGQCYCIPSRGGRDCSECSDFHWGNPSEECKRCECNMKGSKSSHCDKVTGCCECVKGITGCNCDRCARGTTGEVPYCVPCGDCFDDWTDITDLVENDLIKLEQKASNLAVASGSSTKNFSSEYALLEQKLNDIRSFISFNRTDREVKELSDRITYIRKQLEQKKKSREKYYDVEKWTQENPQVQLDESRVEYAKVKKAADKLTKEALELKEAHESGAIDSINRAHRVSDEAAQALSAVEAKLNAELQPALRVLQQRIDASRDNFDRSDQLLKEYLKGVMANLTSSMQSVHGLNEAVCGELTNEKQMCPTKCGGAVCDGKCGTNSSICGGLVDSFWNLVNTKNVFEELYSKQETTFKKILTKLRNSSNSLNNANRDINNLLEYANKSLVTINTKQLELTDLSKSLQNFTQMNKEKPMQIRTNVDYVTNKKLNLQESELDRILDRISELAAQVNVADIERDTLLSKQQSRDIMRDVEQVAAMLPALLSDLNKTTEAFEAEKNKTAANEEKIKEFSSKNTNLQNEIAISKNSIDSIGKIMDNITQSLADLKSKADLDADKEKVSSFAAKQESLKAKVKESGYTLDMTKSNLDVLDTKLKELSKRIQSFLQNKDSKNGADILEKLINLQSSIINKRNSIEEKSNKLKKLEKQNDDIKVKINELKNTLAGLKSKAVEIKTDIQSKEKFINSCS